MARLADVVILVLAWLFVIAIAVRWVLSRGPIQMSRTPARVPIALPLLVLITAVTFLLGYLLGAKNGSENTGVQKAALSSGRPPAQLLNYPGLDSLKMLGIANVGELGIATDSQASGDGRFPVYTSLVFSGWITDPATKLRSGDVFFVIDGRFRYPGIAAGTAAGPGGFVLALPLDRVGPGDHYVQAALRSAKDVGFYLLPRKVQFTVFD